LTAPSVKIERKSKVDRTLQQSPSVNASFVLPPSPPNTSSPNSSGLHPDAGVLVTLPHHQTSANPDFDFLYPDVFGGSGLSPNNGGFDNFNNNSTPFWQSMLGGINF